jgi:uncharacterized membrane protein YqgA involved in biofilm formation
MEETLVNIAMILAGSILGVFIQKKLPPSFQDRAYRAVGFFILAIGLRIFLKYHQPVLILVSLFLGTGLGIWWKVAGKITHMGNYFLKFILEKKIFFPSPSPFEEGFVPASLLFCLGSLTILSGFPGEAQHALWSVKLALAFLPAFILATTLGWGVLFSILSVFLVQVFMSLSGDAIESFFTENIVSDLTSVGGILIALWGLKLSKLTVLSPSDFLPALLVSPFVSWAYYSLLHT